MSSPRLVSEQYMKQMQDIWEEGIIAYNDAPRSEELGALTKTISRLISTYRELDVALSSFAQSSGAFTFKYFPYRKFLYIALSKPFSRLLNDTGYRSMINAKIREYINIFGLDNFAKLATARMEDAVAEFLRRRRYGGW